MEHMSSVVSAWEAVLGAGMTTGIEVGPAWGYEGHSSIPAQA